MDEEEFVKLIWQMPICFYFTTMPSDTSSIRHDTRPPWWLWPGLLCVVAPSVAMAWLYIFADTWQITPLRWPSYVVLGGAVWMIYVTDRLLDHYSRGEAHSTVSVRHRFLWRHRRTAIVLLILLMGLLAILQWTRLPMPLIQWYLWPELLIVIVFFTLSAIVPKEGSVPYFRNVIAGLAFGYGTAMMAHVFSGGSHPVLTLLCSKEMLGFSLLCAANMTAIHVWERETERADEERLKQAGRVLVLPLLLLTVGALGFSLWENWDWLRSFAHATGLHLFFFSIFLSTGLLLVLNRARERFSLEALRMLADVAMLIPLAIYLLVDSV